MKPGIVFDLDGTLVDSLPGIALALNRTLSQLGYEPHPEQEVRSMVGKGARYLCRAAIAPFYGGNVPEQAYHAVHDGFMREYPHTWQNGTVPYPGIMTMLTNLVEQGYPLAVLSNKPHVVTVPLVEHILAGIPFCKVMGFSEIFPRKPDPTSLLSIAHIMNRNREHICMVGDSIHDANTARNAGSQLLLVAWGYSKPEPLMEFCVPVCQHACELHAQILALPNIA